MITVYTYARCGTCRRATNYLRDRGIPFEERAIRETPPSEEELRKMLAHYGGDLRRLFNTSGRDYRELGLKDRMPTLTRDEAFALLRQNGNLVKRPFLIGHGIGRLGFREKEWAAITR